MYNSAVKLHAIINLQYILSDMKSILGFYLIFVYLLVINSVIRLYITLIRKSFSKTNQCFSAGLGEYVGRVLQGLFYI